MGEVVDLRPQVRQVPENEPSDGGGGRPTEIVIRVVFEDDETSQSEETQAEPKEKRWPAFIAGALLGWLWGG